MCNQVGITVGKSMVVLEKLDDFSVVGEIFFFDNGYPLFQGFTCILVQVFNHCSGRVVHIVSICKIVRKTAAIVCSSFIFLDGAMSMLAVDRVQSSIR